MLTIYLGSWENKLMYGAIYQTKFGTNDSYLITIIEGCVVSAPFILCQMALFLNYSNELTFRICFIVLHILLTLAL